MLYKESLFLGPVPLSPGSHTDQQEHFRMKAAISLCVLLVAAVLALGDGAPLPGDEIPTPYRGKMVTELILVM